MQNLSRMVLFVSLSLVKIPQAVQISRFDALLITITAVDDEEGPIAHRLEDLSEDDYDSNSEEQQRLAEQKE